VPVPWLPLVCVRTGAAVPEVPLEGATLAAWLVRVRGRPAAGDAGETLAWAPLVALLGANPDPAEPRPGSAPWVIAVFEPDRLCGGRSWRTTWIVRLITWVRTSAAGC
jgi:hypothetical protein